MPTRAAAMREAAALKESLAASLLPPSVTPAYSEAIETNLATAYRSHDVSGSTTAKQSNKYAPALKSRKKLAPPKNQNTIQPVVGDWDVLPHGLGKKGDLLELESANKSLREISPLPPEKRARRGKGTNESIRDGSPTVEGGNGKAIEDQTDNRDIDMPEPEEYNLKGAQKSKGRRGRAKKIDSATAKSTGVTQNANPAFDGPLKEDLLKTGRRKATSAKTDADTNLEDRGSEEQQPKKKRNVQKKEAINTSQTVLDDADDLIGPVGAVTKKGRKNKANKYGLTPGYSPFPDHLMPIPEACEEVARLLSELHGEVKPPEKIPAPSMEVAGCGEVPDLLDAILRTLLSASTTANNANLSLKGLKEKFGLRTSGLGEGSVNWEAVREADLPTIIEAIKRGGLAKSKGTNMKKILDVIYEQNCQRRKLSLGLKETGELADISGLKQETQDQKDMETIKADQNMLSMDHVFELTTDEAMEEMTKLPGIGVKTASCVILFCMKRPSFAVDTHVWRHCKMLGWVPSTATRDQTFSHCEVRVPDHLKYPLHQLFLRHGKTCGRCKAKSSGEDWTSTVCPIEHLVKRSERKRLPVKKANSFAGKKGGIKRKKTDEETEESDIEIEEGISTDYEEITD